MNLYAYAGNNPISYDDPFGLAQCPDHFKSFSGPQAQCVLQQLGKAAPVINHEVATFIPNSILNAAVGMGAGKLIGAVAGKLLGSAADATATKAVQHFTSVENAAKIEGSGALASGSFVTVPEAVAGKTASQVEGLLEIGQGKGAMSAALRVPADALAVPPGAPLTSGGAPQFVLNRAIPVAPGSFTPTPQ